MFTLTTRRWALVALATAGLLFLAAMLFGGAHDSVVGPAGIVTMGVFATACAVNATWTARGRQRSAWIALATGVGGWAAGSAVWCYVALGGTAPISITTVGELGYVVLPLCALGAAVLVPNRNDDLFGIGLLLDGVLVAAALFLAIGSLVVDAAPGASITRILLAVITAIYLGLAVIGLVVMRATEPRRRLSTSLLTTGFAAIGVAGGLHLYGNGADHIPGDVVTFGWISGTYFLALSAIVFRMGPDLDAGRTPGLSRQAMWLPYLPVSVALAIFAVRFWPRDRGNAFVFAAGMFLSVVVLLRQLLVLDRRRRLLEALADAALRDPTTGLANRRLLDERLEHAVQLHLRLAVPISLLRARVDDFKLVDDSLGYAAGDELLRSVGARIQSGVRTDDTVARMGGDEFAILLEDPPDIAVQVAERLARSFDSPLQVGDREVYVHLSVGVASTGSDYGPVLTAENLLSRAEAARLRAEPTTASAVQTFSPEMDADLSGRQASRDGAARLQLLWDLRRAIDDRLLNLVYQPQFEMRSGAICGAEALLRWKHPTLGILEPQEFLPLVREHGLMDAVTDMVLWRAVADASEWHAQGTDIPVAINLWARSLDEDTLPDRIMSVLDAHGMSARLLTVEITEELVVADFVKVRAVLNRLRSAGIRVSIDDFGSGYSTLTYLRELPIDEVKLDRQLIAPILYDRRAATIARSVIELAEEFGIASVAEGVENEETVRWLKRFGCDVIQGNYFCGPLPAREIPLIQSKRVPETR
ncbi:hypothetical protein GCM10009641_56510 [Mycobacterium cookii]|uniref:GGDEF-domain containing protein n=1 Tax=Mycobacterium cookii TaxID=1775 RepID=A0A7I7KTJ0_9MYCO|nr:bifunctional diguanylate cyclase/phosphodiesterase [Mycobacterium cookii]MCV7332071.1 bifunctional diguanylate cyclase/phosphodiesterase [Mycobacterium cookii]BBX44672.1 hypothetical protein MCOO_06870 [Mycobacterium cookii]